MHVQYSRVNHKTAPSMSRLQITSENFLGDKQGRTFADVADDPEQPFAELLEFFTDEVRQRRMEESEIHHDRPALAGAIRELESHPAIGQCLAGGDRRRSKRLRQAVGVVVRIIMEARGWKKTGRKGSLGVQATGNPGKPKHNSGGLALWFIRAERYERVESMPFRSVRERCQELETETSRPVASDSKKPHSNGSTPKAFAEGKQS